MVPNSMTLWKKQNYDDSKKRVGEKNDVKNIAE